MGSVLIINKKGKKILLAILKNNRLTEYYSNSNIRVFIGDIYIGRVIYIYNSMNSIFIDIGYFKYGFLNFSDIGKYYLSLTKKKVVYNKLKGNNVKNNFKLGQYIIVQVIKNCIYNKGPKLTCYLKLVGKYIILLPFKKNIYISKKIKKKSCKYILLPNYWGCIYRTDSYNKLRKKIKFEIYILLKTWYSIFTKIKKKRIYKLYSNNNILLNFFKNKYYKFKKIIANDIKICNDIKYYCFYLNIKNNEIYYYDEKNVSIFDKFDINKQINVLFNKYVYLSDGTNLIIENTETLNVIDINSNMKNNNTSLGVNKIAVEEIVRQIILRNLSGLIIIDLIDIKKNKDKKKIYNDIKKEMKIDNVKHKILPPSEFNIIQITREKNYYKFNNKTYNNNKNSWFLNFKKYIFRIERSFYKILLKKGVEKINIFLYVSPLLYTYLKYGFYSYYFKWFIKYRTSIIILKKFNYKLFEYKIKTSN